VPRREPTPEQVRTGGGAGLIGLAGIGGLIAGVEMGKPLVAIVGFGLALMAAMAGAHGGA